MNENFVRTILSVRGEQAGKQWLDDIPRLLGVIERKWSLTVLEPFALSYNYVAPALRSDGTPVVLKLGFPGDNEFKSEVAALKYFAGRGAVRFLDQDEETTAVLLERVVPGTPLADFVRFPQGDEQATRVAAQVAKKLWKPAPQSDALIPLERWYGGFARLRTRFGGGTGPLPAALVAEGERLFGALLSTTQTPMLLHGDFHHLNILRSGADDWVIIDPKGVIGDPGYELGAFLYNPMPQLIGWPGVKGILKRRIDILAEALDMDWQRLLEWGIAQSVLSAVWSVEDYEPNWDYTLKVAALLLEL